MWHSWMFSSYINYWMIGWISHMCISGISLAMCTISVCRILFSQHYRYVFGAKQCCCPCHCDLCS